MNDMDNMMLALLHGMVTGAAGGVSIAQLTAYWLPDDQRELGRWAGLAVYAVLFFALSAKMVLMITVALVWGALHSYYGETRQYAVWFILITSLLVTVNLLA